MKWWFYCSSVARVMPFRSTLCNYVAPFHRPSIAQLIILTLFATMQYSRYAVVLLMQIMSTPRKPSLKLRSCRLTLRRSVTATADVSGCSVWICGTCDAKASSYLGSGRMTEVIRVALGLYMQKYWVLGIATAQVGDSYQRTLDWPIYSHYRCTKHLSSVDYFLVWLYLYMSVCHP